ncbi:ATP-binding protein [Thalassotalea ganghwensis]
MEEIEKPLVSIKNKERKKRILQVFWVSQFALLLALFQPIMNSDWRNLALIVFFFSLLFIAFFYARKGNLDLAANVITCVLTMLALSLAWLNQGVRDEALLIFPALITFGILTGSRIVVKVMLALILVNVLIMGLVNQFGWHTHYLSGSGLESAIVIIIIFSVVYYSIRLLGVDLMEANERLYQHQQELEAQVQDRTKELQQSIKLLTEAKNELVEVEKMASLGRLVAGIAHEINTPIGIAVTAGTSMKDYSDEIEALLEQGQLSRKQLFEHLKRNADTFELLNANLIRAANLIADFKEVAVLNEGLRRCKFELGQEIKNIFSQLQTEQEKLCYRVYCQCPDDLYVYQDQEVLTKILTNLYMNSLKHGFENKPQGEISVSVTVDDDNQVELAYADNGTGIADEHVGHIFEPFYTTKRGRGGTGLGMHIVFNLVTHSLNGQISYQGKFGLGAKFVIKFLAEAAK